MPAEVVESRSEAEFKEAFPVIRELHGELDERSYLDLLAEMAPAGYRLFAIREPGSIVAAAGVQVLTNLYYERCWFERPGCSMRKALRVTSERRRRSPRPPARSGLPQGQRRTG